MLCSRMFYGVLNVNGCNSEQKSAILPVVLYGYDRWSVTLRDERTFRMFENSLLFGNNRDGGGGGGGEN